MPVARKIKAFYKKAVEDLVMENNSRFYIFIEMKAKIDSGLVFFSQTQLRINRIKANKLLRNRI